MNILIGGGSGFIGRTLVPVLLKAGHTISVIGRDEDKIRQLFLNTVKVITWDTLSTNEPSDYDAIINLTGANIADKRWTEKTKAILLSSRVDSVTHLIDWCKRSTGRKPHLYNASAVGYYPLQEKIIESEPRYSEEAGLALKPDASFSCSLTRQWEAAAMKAESIGMPVTIMRFGVALHRGEGMLKKLTLPTKFGLGSVMGTGLQPISWVEADDLVNAILFLLNHPDITGVINLVAPEVTTNKVFMKTLASILHRPLLLWMPVWLVKTLFGQMGEELLLAGQVVIPKRLLAYKFKFQYPTLQSALMHEFANNGR